MSLRTFHIIFITLSVVMCIASAGLIVLLAGNESWAWPGVGGAVAGCAALLVYARYFMRRYANILPKG